MRISTALFSLAVALGVVSAIPFNLAPAPATVEECGPETDLLKIEYVNITPNPPLKGQTLTIEGKGQLSGDIVEGAQIFVVVK
ncbi:hypothetical protein BGZ54_000553 [Gamsiella multidivaricata]|nr:hypothetical protein BGZ54_000553 [Gamsiella multidivaricata]